MKTQVTDWEEIVTTHISDKGFLCKIYKELQINENTTQ